METKENMVITSRLQKIYEEQSSFEQFRKSCIKEGIDEKQAEVIYFKFVEQENASSDDTLLEDDFDLDCTDSVKMYLNELGNDPLLSLEEEQELFKRYEAGDAEARDRIIRFNLRLVISVAKRYVGGSNLSIMDLRSPALITGRDISFPLMRLGGFDRRLHGLSVMTVVQFVFRSISLINLIKLTGWKLN